MSSCIIGFTITPTSLNKTVDEGVAVFHCQHRSSHEIVWMVNGSSFSTPNFTTETVRLGDGGFNSSLSIATLLEDNQTTVACGAVFFDGRPLNFTPPVILLIQGIYKLGQVLEYLWLFTIVEIGCLRRTWKYQQS